MEVTVPMLELRLFGSFELAFAGDSDPAKSLLAQPKRAALLVYLTLGSRTGFVRRDKLAALFWPDADETHARRALNQALHYLRDTLGAGVLTTRGEEDVGVDRTRLDCDVHRVRDLLAHDRLDEALSLYRGALLPGFHVRASNDFDDWLDQERRTLGEQMTTAAIALSNRAASHGDSSVAVHWARRAMDLAPLDERCARQIIRALMNDGNAASARLEYDRFAQRMRRALEIEPSSATAALLDQRPVSAPSALPALAVDRAVRPVTRTRRRRLVVTAALASVAVASFATDARRSSDSPGLPHRRESRPAILIVDLAGPVSDTGLGAVATQLLLSGLQDSRSARVVWSGELPAALSRMQLSAGAAVRGGVARELAIREGYGAVLEGAVRNAGDKLLVSISLVDPSTGHIFFTNAALANDATSITRTVDTLVRTFRRRIGDSKDAIARTKALEQVTTPSFAALRAYTDASRLGPFEDARPRALLERAIAIDTGFAAAYVKLGMLAAWSSQAERSSELLAKALHHANRASDYERTRIEAMLYTHGRFFDADRALAAWQVLLDRDSTDGAALLNAAWLLDTQRRYEAAERLRERAMSHGDSTIQTAFMNLARDRFLTGRSTEAWRTLDAIIRRSPRSLALTYRARARIEVGSLDSARADLRRASELCPPADRGAIGSLVALLYASAERQAGHLARAREYDAERARLAAETGDTRREFDARLAHVHEATRLLSRPDLTRDELPALRRLAETIKGVDRPIPALAEAYAEVGDPATAASLLREYERGVPSGEWRELAPDRHRAWAYIALAEGRPQEAVRELRSADVGTCAVCVLPMLSLAYERASQPDSAIAMGERYFAFVDPVAAAGDGFYRPILHRRLGSLYAQRGDLAHAEQHLRTFLSMWRNADPELEPQLEAARREWITVTEHRSR
jgi:DNA-binding SARP family transcriptional activator/tetratricopeptide (TPR) repeat protein